jgi:peptide deformylase
MTKLTILRYPDERLHTVAKPVLVIDGRIERIAMDMLETMYDAGGIGLAATQVDIHQRLVVMDLSEECNQPMVFINPEILEYSVGEHQSEEGCLSVPQIREKVSRYDAVRIRYTDLKNKTSEFEAEGLFAVCIQHELDHLIGKVFIEYLSPLKRSRIKVKLRKRLEDE